MYDPWVVQTFEQVFASIDAGDFALVSRAGSEHTGREPLEGPRPAAPGAESSAKSLSPGESHAQGSLIALECEALLLRACPMIPAGLAVFYRYDLLTDKLVAHHITGDEGAAVSGSQMGLGQNLSGWVAANRQAIVNSDAALDLGDLVDRFTPKLQHCLSVPSTLAGPTRRRCSLYPQTHSHRTMSAGAAEWPPRSSMQSRQGTPDIRPSPSKWHDRCDFHLHGDFS